MPHFFSTIATSYLLYLEKRLASRQAKTLQDARWIAQDREGEWHAYGARPLLSQLGWGCEESATFLFRGHPNDNWSETAKEVMRPNNPLRRHLEQTYRLPQLLTTPITWPGGLRRDQQP